MPRVAGYPGRTVALEPLRPPRAEGESAAPGLASMGQALGQVAEVADKFQLEADITAAKSIDTAFRQSVLELGTGPNGYYTQAGENAVRAHEGYQKEVERLHREAKERLGSGRAGRLGSDSLDDFFLAEQARSTQHYRAEQATWADETSKARTELAAAEGVAFYNDDPTFRKSLDTIAYEALERGQRAGQSEETIASEILGLQSKMIAAAIASAKERDPRDALVLFKKWGSRLDAGTRAAVSNEVFEAARTISAIEISERLIAGGGSQSAQLAAVREIEDTELRDSVRTRVNQFWTDQRAGHDAAVRDLDAATTRRVLSGDLKNVEDLPQGLSGGAQRSLATIIRQQAAGTYGDVSDFAVWQKWKTMPDSELAKQEPNGVWALALGPTEFPKFVEDVGRARNALEGKAPKLQVTQQLVNQQTMLYARAAGVYAKPSDGEYQQKRHRDFDNYVRLELQRFDDPSFDDLLGVLQQATRAYTVDVTGPFNETRLGFQLTPEDVPNVEMTDEDLNEATRIAIERNKNNGITTAPTAEEIRGIFDHWLLTGEFE